MDVTCGTSGNSARHELAVVVMTAALGIVLASLVAFIPWYDADGTRQLAVVAGQAVDRAIALLAVLFS